MMKYKVNEIFTSIDGEGSRSGYTTNFIRLYGCNIKCSYCDSLYACEGGEYTEMSVEQIANKLDANIHNITLTGGEPLDREHALNLVKMLSDLGYHVNIETNGTIDFSEFQNVPNVMITMDYKTMSSGYSSEMDESLIAKLRPKDDLKFVVGSGEDLNQMCDVLRTNPTKATIFVSPVYDNLTPKQIAEFLIANNITDIRLQLQAHKFIWPPEMRGV